MKPLLIVGNWKSNKTISEAKTWLQEWHIKCQISNVKLKAIEIVLCVPFTLLSFIKDQLKYLNSPIQLGAQDISPFSEGAYTGAVNARQLKELVDWVIIGHSERRKGFAETDEILAKKFEMAQKENLKVIYCVQDQFTPLPSKVDIVSYEPPWAISTVSNWKTEDPTKANLVCQTFKDKGISLVLYGGSVTPENIKSFTDQSSIDGVLSGGVSLDAVRFGALVVAASSQ